jgi:hypothetical protein
MEKQLTDKQIATTRQRATELIEQHQREIRRLTTLVNGTASDREMRGAYRRLRFEALCKVFNNGSSMRRRDKQPAFQESRQDTRDPLSKELSRWDA